jgi:hypothetical protein
MMEHSQVTQIRAAIKRIGQKRLGPPDTLTLMALDNIADLEQLERLIDRLLTAASWQELLSETDCPQV